MTGIGQRTPRIRDDAWLRIVRAMPCLICRRTPSDPAHIRAAAPRYRKRLTGLGEKSDDKWVLPLCRPHHDEQHHRGDEMAWWASKGIPDPHAVAIALYASRPVTTPRAERAPKVAKVSTRKPREQRAKIFTRVHTWVKRKLTSRSTFQNRGTK